MTGAMARCRAFMSTRQAAVSTGSPHGAKPNAGTRISARLAGVHPVYGCWRASGRVQGAGHAEFDRAGGRLGVLGAPAWAGAAHVVKLGPVGVEQVFREGVPERDGRPAEARSLGAAGHDELPDARTGDPGLLIGRVAERPGSRPWSARIR